MEATKLTPVEYAKLRGIRSQLIYYYIRTNRIKVSFCDCGRKIIDVAEADAFIHQMVSGR